MLTPTFGSYQTLLTTCSMCCSIFRDECQSSEFLTKIYRVKMLIFLHLTGHALFAFLYRGWFNIPLDAQLLLLSPIRMSISAVLWRALVGIICISSLLGQVVSTAFSIPQGKGFKAQVLLRRLHVKTLLRHRTELCNWQHRCRSDFRMPVLWRLVKIG